MAEPILGRTIVGIDYAPAEKYGFYTGRDIPIIELDDGSVIYAMQDEEGNGPGVLMRRSTCSDEYIE